MGASLVAALAALVPVVVYFSRIDPSISANATAITRLEATVEAQRVQTSKDIDQQANRITRIEETRSVNLQRLSKVEEAVQGMKDTLTSINSKLDRVLLRR